MSRLNGSAHKETMNRFIGNDGSIDAKIAKAIEDTYRLKATSSRAFFGKGILWESNFSAAGARVITPFEKGSKDGTRGMLCGSSRWGGHDVVG